MGYGAVDDGVLIASVLRLYAAHVRLALHVMNSSANMATLAMPVGGEVVGAQDPTHYDVPRTRNELKKAILRFATDTFRGMQIDVMLDPEYYTPQLAEDAIN
jgi:hypothetical protein